MTIFYFVPAFLPKETGFSIAFKNFCLSILDNERIEQLYVISPEDNPPLIHSKIRYIYFDKYIWCERLVKYLGPHIGSIIINLYLRFWIKQLNVDEKNSLFFVESVLLSYLSFFLHKKYKYTPTVTRIHGALPEVAIWTGEKLRRDLMKLLLKTKNISVTTYHYIDYLKTYFSLKQDNEIKFFIIPNSLPKVKVNNSTKRNNKLKLMQLGRMDKQGYFQKGFQDTLQAFYYLETIYSPRDLADIECTFIGNGDLSNEFKKHLSKLKYIKTKLLTSISNDKVQLELDRSDVILMPSRYEGMSMFATEALAKGKAFIFTSDGGMRDMIFNNYNGISIRPFDYLELAKAILDLKNSSSKIDLFSSNSIKLFNQEFSHEKTNEKFDVLLKTLHD
ncbi:glycosyltransferase family 4 protein [Arenibacter amylolyticus]|uniref:glycosyltransferase family 4 protein n=1 Tax=Arenibacter amylolyticus TaxID=1406873 RepID=UPI000A380381|nr:glycosyltransferase family 4 protein [Arenibacter amylolyticus]